MADELVELARRLDDPGLSSRTAARRVHASLEIGDRVQAESSLATLRALAAKVPEPFIAYLRLLLEFGWALLQGDLTAAEQWATQAHVVGTAAGQPDASMFFGAHLFHVRYFQGQSGALAEQVMHLADGQGNLRGWRAGAAALAMIQSGREDDARELALAEDLKGLPRDEAWPIVMMLWADACSRLSIPDRASELHELLAPFSGQLAVSGAHVYGSFDWALGAVLAASRGPCEEAEIHFAAAADIETRLCAPLLLARTQARWSRALIMRGDPEDLSRARPMLERAEDTAGRLAAEGIRQEIAKCRAELGAAGA